ncbi:hypothetical protein HNV10_05660 [Winogradskyella litoriviva]|uniref:Uncharacterized protein n=1 Tax=Winogradskyella litoriviva TaxID=1220182 RepID=A0ABX2E424_9FLAO|nr:hypothetical protein [Winogradskyella litoriviva]NRD22716.1 hypothetical protein [Winogradskyella litoriviva]
MKKIILGLFVLLNIACSSSDDDDPSNFTLTLSAIEEIEVDARLDVMVNANEPMQSLKVSLDNFETSVTNYNDLGSATPRYFSFNNLGQQTIYFTAKNTDNVEVTESITVNVVRGNAVKLEQIQLNSFFNLGNTWDDEFPSSNINHLADVSFGLLKPPVNLLTGLRPSAPSLSWFWYRSVTHYNESSLTWNLQNEDLYVNIDEVSAYIGFLDTDGEFAQDLMLGPPSEIVMPIADYIDTQPINITVDEPSIDLNFTVAIDW